MSSSCSFQITRTKEDIGNSFVLVSQRLLKLEQRLEFIEKQVISIRQSNNQKGIEKFEQVQQVLKDCKDLLESSHTSDELI